MFALFTKHHGFKEEKEWRIVYHPDNDREKKFSHMLDYHVSSRGVEPKLKLIIEPIEGAFTEGFTFEKITKELIL